MKPEAPGAAVVAVLERLSAVSDIATACSIILDQAATITRVSRAVVAVRGDRGLVGCNRGVDDSVLTRILCESDETGSAIAEAIAHLSEPAVRRGDWIPELGFGSCLLIPVRGTGTTSNLGVVILDASKIDAATTLVADVLDRCGPALERVIQVADLTDRVRQIDRQQDLLSSDRLNMILENVSDPILVTDEHSNIILMNTEADRLFVWESGPVVKDQSAQHLVRSNDARFTTLISNFLLRDEPRQMERIVVVDPESRERIPVEVVSSKIFNASGEATAIVSVLHDLTQSVENERLARELKQLNDQLEDRIRQATLELEERNRRLQWQSHELQKASRLKSEFLANMSHELRTPINVIVGYTSLMRERIYGDLTPPQEEALAKTHTTSQHLLELINDILDLSKIEAGKMPVHIESVAVQDVVAELSASVQPMARQKELTFETIIEGELQPINTDRTKVKQVLLNLLSNAIKFTQEGRVTVRVSMAGEHRVRFDVEDTGIGIKPEDLQGIFDDFRQADQSHTKEYGGTGLGLSITRKLLTLLNGQISVESAYNEGTRFVVELPSLPVFDPTG